MPPEALKLKMFILFCFAAKWREDMQSGTLDKQWREYAKHAWDIAPTLGNL